MAFDTGPLSSSVCMQLWNGGSWESASSWPSGAEFSLLVTSGLMPQFDEIATVSILSYVETTYPVVVINSGPARPVLELTVDDACDFFAGEASVMRSLDVLREIGLGYLRLGQPATELSGGEAQRIKLATELQRAQRGNTIYILDEPTSGLHPSDSDRLMQHLQGLVDAGNTVVVVEHDMRAITQADWIIDLGPGAGEDGGRIVASGVPGVVAEAEGSLTARYLKAAL